MAFDKAMSCAFVFVSAFVLFGDKAAADDLSCQDRIVSLGYSAYEVQALCGPPDAVQQRVESRTVQRPVSVPCAARRGIGRCVVLVGGYGRRDGRGMDLRLRAAALPAIL